MPKRLSSAETLKLVELYRDHECLWDIFSENYKNANLRLVALQQICDAMAIDGMTVEDIKYKLKTLRSTYYLEVDKIRKGIERGVPYTTKIGWFDEMHSFIRNVVVKRKSFHDISGQDMVEETTTETMNRIQETIIKQDLDDTEDPLTEPEFQQIEPQRMEPQPKKRKTSQVNKMAETKGAENQETWIEWDYRDDRRMALPGEDEYDMFGKHVACQLRQLSTLQYLLAQEAIQSTITKSRITDLEKKDTK